MFLQFIKILYRNNTSYIINNGFLSSPINLERRLRQGCPLSLPLYVIQGQITTTNISKNEKIEGITIPNYTKQIKISQYADDSNFLFKIQESIKHVFKFFKKLKKATGSSINLEKTKLLPINTDQISIIQKNIPNITILKRYQYIKILGVYFSEDLKNTIITNWQQTISKMENHIKKLSSRTLSLSGKATIINTLLLSKTTF